MSATKVLPAMMGRNYFWEFSLRLYSEPDIEQWCLWLQDHCGANVNLVLFCSYAGVNGIALDHKVFMQLSGLVRTWDQSVVQPLRAVRRTLSDIPMSGDQAAIGNMVLKAELAAERQVQDQLAKWMAGVERHCKGNATQIISSNLACYLAQLKGNQRAATRVMKSSKLTETRVIEAALRAAADVLG